MSFRLHPTKNKNLPPGEPRYYQIVTGRGADRVTLVRQFKTSAAAEIYDNELKRAHSSDTFAPDIIPMFKQMIPDFLHYYEHELERQPSSVEAWLKGWGNLKKHFADLKPTQLTPAIIEDYKQARLKQRAGFKTSLVKKRTVQKELHNLSSLIKYAVEKNLCTPLPFKIRGFLKKRMKPEPILIPTPDQIQEMFRISGKYRPDLLPYYHLVYYTGFRSKEARTIKRKNIDLNWGIIKIQGKGGKWRWMPIVNQFRPTLEKLCEGKQPDDYLLISKRTGQIFSENSGKMDKAATAAGITTHITLHVLRKCFATHCLYWGVDMRTLQILLGHEDIKTTETYTPLPPSFLIRQLQGFDRRTNEHEQITAQI